MQEIKVITRMDIDTRTVFNGAMIRRTATLIVGIGYYVDNSVVAERDKVYKFDPDDAMRDMDEFRRQFKAGRFLYSEDFGMWGGFNVPHFDPSKDYKVTIDDAANVADWLGADFNPASEPPPTQKTITDGQKRLPAGGR